METDTALQAIIALATQRKIDLDDVYVGFRMADRDISAQDIEHALCSPIGIVESREQRSDWVVTGRDLDGNRLDVACYVTDFVVVVTIWRPTP